MSLQFKVRRRSEFPPPPSPLGQSSISTIEENRKEQSNSLRIRDDHSISTKASSLRGHKRVGTEVFPSRNPGELAPISPFVRIAFADEDAIRTPGGPARQVREEDSGADHQGARGVPTVGDLDARRPSWTTTELIDSSPFGCLVRVWPPSARLHARTLTMTSSSQSRMVPPAPGRPASLYSYPPQPFSTLRPAAEYPLLYEKPGYCYGIW